MLKQVSIHHLIVAALLDLAQVCMVVTFHSKFIPPFTWGRFENYGKQDIAAFLTALERMMLRRNLYINDNEVNKLKGIYDAVSELLTSKESD